MGDLSFLNPAWLAAAPAFLGALVLLYFLKLKRREVRVASTYLWRTALQDLRVNSPLQRLRMNLLLLLQLLALALVLLALARPVSNLGLLGGRDRILLVDVSASMQATDGGDNPGEKTRLQRAVEEATRVVEGMSRGDQAILLAFCDEPRVLTPLTGSRRVLLEALAGLRATDRQSELAGALHRVQTLLADANRQPEVYVFSDGRVGPLEEAVLDAAVPLRFVRTGTADANVGVVGVEVRAGATLDDDHRVFASLQNAGAAPIEVGVDLLVDDELLASRKVAIEAGATVSTPFEVPLRREGRLQVRLSGHRDPLPVDDVAFALVREQEPLRVLLVTTGNLFLDSALRADPLVWTDPRGELPVMLPEAFDPQDPTLLDHDMIVLDRVRPRDLPPGNYLVFGAAPPFTALTDDREVKDAKVLDWDESHEVARFVNFATLVLPTARRMTLREDRDQVVVRGNQGPLVFEAREGDARAVVCAFDLLSLPVDGAWTFDPSFPIFLANAVRYLGGSGRNSKSLLVRTGGTAELRLPNGAARAVIDPPHGDPFEQEVRPGDDALRVTGLERAGFYTVSFKGPDGAELRRTMFAANLSDAEESRIAPIAEMKVAERDPVAGTSEVEASQQEVWKLAAALALLFVMAEWWVYNRRVFL